MIWFNYENRDFIYYSVLLLYMQESSSNYKFKRRNKCYTININKFYVESFWFFYWTFNDHQSLKIKDIIWQDHRYLSFYFFVYLCGVCVSVRLSVLCRPQFLSHKLVDPYLVWPYEQLDAIKKCFLIEGFIN